MANIVYPKFTGERGIGYWLRPKNLWASRQIFMRVDYSNEWRYEFGNPDPPDRAVQLSSIIKSNKNTRESFKIIILGDTGEGDRSQYGLLPLLREFNPDMIIINGDVAYPAGRIGAGKNDDDFMAGFFYPYSNLDIPIWATPGNHEYYSPNNGRDFYDIFCTRKYDYYWSQFGLDHNKLQPGMFWELNDSIGNSQLVIIGIDTGKSANLDGHNYWWQFWKSKIHPDHIQHNWLDERLKKAQENNSKVILLFHIPALAKENHLEKNLSTLHQIISNYNCVKLVLCGHDHNHQQYTSDIFRNYLSNEAAHREVKNFHSTYMVNGGGGAFLQSTNYTDGPYQSVRYPNREEWRQYANWARRIVSDWGKNKSWISRAVGEFSQEAFEDCDSARFLSFVLVEFNSDWPDNHTNEIRVTPVFLDDLNLLYDQDETVNVLDKNYHINNHRVNACRQNEYSARGNLEIRF